MIKFIKKIFSAENLKKAMVYNSLTNPNINSTEIVFLINVLKTIDSKDINKNINKEVNIKKVA